MDQTVLSGLFALGGAVVGGLVTIGATIISNRKQVNLELKKQRIDFLKNEVIKLEGILTEISSPLPERGVLESTTQKKQILQNSLHILTKTKYDKLFKKLDKEMNGLWGLQNIQVASYTNSEFDEFDEQKLNIEKVITEFRDLILIEIGDIKLLLRKEMSF